jgi:3-deoxy-D-manno-octulosonic-acid transferase
MEVFSLLKQSLSKDRSNRYVWFHAASLGEFEQGRPVMEALRKSHPEYKIILTFFSPSGYEVRKNYNGADIVCYLPLDTPRNAKRFVDLVNPEKIIFIKYEFWPNFLSYCRKKEISTYVISAVFRKSQIFFKWYGKPYANILSSIKCMYVQDENSKKLLSSIGITNVTVAGDTRFDRVMEIFENARQLPIAESFREGNRVLVAGSSWPKDEELIFKYLQSNPELKLIIAPHVLSVDHLNDIEERIGVSCIRYSAATNESVKEVRCLLIDNMGMLSSLYRYGDIAYIGGGFGVGIHNTLEAAVYGIPVVFGPNFGKFNEAKDLVALGGGFSIQDYVELQSTLDWLLLHKGAGKIAGNYVKQNQGATMKIIEGIFS